MDSRCNRSNISESQFTVSNLMPNKKYEFRVAAVNEAGVGEWSQCSDLIEAKNPEGVYYRHLLMISEYCVPPG